MARDYWERLGMLKEINFFSLHLPIANLAWVLSRPNTSRRHFFIECFFHPQRISNFIIDKNTKQERNLWASNVQKYAEKINNETKNELIILREISHKKKMFFVDLTRQPFAFLYSGTIFMRIYLALLGLRQTVPAKEKKSFEKIDSLAKLKNECLILLSSPSKAFDFLTGLKLAYKYQFYNKEIVKQVLAMDLTGIPLIEPMLLVQQKETFLKKLNQIKKNKEEAYPKDRKEAIEALKFLASQI